MQLLSSEAKLRCSKKWKLRFCVLVKESPVADRLVLNVYKNEKALKKLQAVKNAIFIESFYGIESGVDFDRESHTLSIISGNSITLLALESEESLIEWEHMLKKHLGPSCAFHVKLLEVPNDCVLVDGTVKLYIHDGRFCVVHGFPLQMWGHWRFAHVRRFGPIHNKFMFEIGRRADNGKGEGIYLLLSGQIDQISKAFSLANKQMLSREIFPCNASGGASVDSLSLGGGVVRSPSISQSEVSFGSDRRPLLPQRSLTSINRAGDYPTIYRDSGFTNEVFDLSESTQGLALSSTSTLRQRSLSGPAKPRQQQRQNIHHQVLQLDLATTAEASIVGREEDQQLDDTIVADNINNLNANATYVELRDGGSIDNLASCFPNVGATTGSFSSTLLRKFQKRQNAASSTGASADTACRPESKENLGASSSELAGMSDDYMQSESARLYAARQLKQEGTSPSKRNETYRSAIALTKSTSYPGSRLPIDDDSALSPPRSSANRMLSIGRRPQAELSSRQGGSPLQAQQIPSLLPQLSPGGASQQSLGSTQPSPCCLCACCRDYMNQAFIDSLQHYYNIEKIIFTVSNKSKCCDHVCTAGGAGCGNNGSAPCSLSPTLGSLPALIRSSYTPMKPSCFYTPMEPYYGYHGSGNPPVFCASGARLYADDAMLNNVPASRVPVFSVPRCCPSFPPVAVVRDDCLLAAPTTGVFSCQQLGSHAAHLNSQPMEPSIVMPDAKDKESPPPPPDPGCKNSDDDRAAIASSSKTSSYEDHNDLQLDAVPGLSSSAYINVSAVRPEEYSSCVVTVCSKSSREATQDVALEENNIRVEMEILSVKRTQPKSSSATPKSGPSPRPSSLLLLPADTTLSGSSSGNLDDLAENSTTISLSAVSSSVFGPEDQSEFGGDDTPPQLGLRSNSAGSGSSTSTSQHFHRLIQMQPFKPFALRDVGESGGVGASSSIASRRNLDSSTRRQLCNVYNQPVGGTFSIYDEDSEPDSPFVDPTLILLLPSTPPTPGSTASGSSASRLRIAADLSSTQASPAVPNLRKYGQSKSLPPGIAAPSVSAKRSMDAYAEGLKHSLNICKKASGITAPANEASNLAATSAKSSENVSFDRRPSWPLFSPSSRLASTDQQTPSHDLESPRVFRFPPSQAQDLTYLELERSEPNSENASPPASALLAKTPKTPATAAMLSARTPSCASASSTGSAGVTYAQIDSIATVAAMKITRDRQIEREQQQSCSSASRSASVQNLALFSSPSSQRLNSNGSSLDDSCLPPTSPTTSSSATEGSFSPQATSSISVVKRIRKRLKASLADRTKAKTSVSTKSSLTNLNEV